MSQPGLRFADVQSGGRIVRRVLCRTETEATAPKFMIQLTRLNGQPLIINSDMIKLIENAPDTVISLVNGEKFVVREPGEQVLERIVQFRRRVLDGLRLNFAGWTAPRTEAVEPDSTESSREEP